MNDLDLIMIGPIRPNSAAIFKKINEANIFKTKTFATWSISPGIEKKHLKNWNVEICTDPGELNNASVKSKNILRAATLVAAATKHLQSEFCFRGRSDIALSPKLEKKLSSGAIYDNLMNGSIYLDRVGTTKDWFHFSDFCMLAQSNVIKEASRKLLQRLTSKSELDHLVNLVQTSNRKLFHSKRYEERLPAETINFILSFTKKSILEYKNLSELQSEMILQTDAIKYFSLNDFNRGRRLDPRLGLKAFYRYSRGNLEPGSAVSKFIDKYYE